MMVYGEIQEGLWIFGETIYETIIREIKEENLKIFNIYFGEEQHHIYPNKDEVYFVNIIFETDTYSGKIVNDSESCELRFFDIDNLQTNITNPFECVVRDLKQKI